MRNVYKTSSVRNGFMFRVSKGSVVMSIKIVFPTKIHTNFSKLETLPYNAV
jgi:hypothetical protein